MPQELIVIFLLFFAVLTFGWFYWQRAKARASTTATDATTGATTDATAPASEAQDTTTTPPAS